MDQFSDGMSSAGDAADGLLGKLAAVAAVAGVGLSFASVIETGNEFTRTLNSLSGVTGATAAEMDTLKQKSMELGNDVDLSATSANDAAAAMLELSKGGFTVEQSMEAAKGTLQLAAAAQIDAASAATIQSQALQAFGLDASYAATASDVLANAANASSAEITDIAAGLSQSGAVANQFGLSIEDTSATLGMLANAGITGSDAGTLLKSTLLSLTDTSKPAQGAMEELGLTVYDAQGKFVGMESLIGQLKTASEELTDEQYQQATATLLGSDAMRLGGVAAEQGADGFNAMRVAVGEQGAAAALAAAQNQGLPGVFERMENTSERLQLQLYDLIDGPLTSLGNGLVNLADGALDQFDTVLTGQNDTVNALGASVSGLAMSDFPMLQAAWGNLRTAGESIVNIAQSFGTALIDIGEGALSAGGLLDTLQAAGQGAAAGFDGALNVIEPLAAGIGSLASMFGNLPGPIQSAAIALVALRVAQSVFSTQIATASTGLRNYATGIRNFATVTGTAVQTSRNLGGSLQNASVRMGSFGSSIASLGQRMPTIAAVQSSFVGASTSAALAGQSFARTQGAIAATGTAMKAAAGGLFSALGGPAGIAIAAAVVGLSLYAANQRKAAQAAAEHKAAVDNLVSSIDAETGAVTESTVQAQAKSLADSGMIQSAKNYGIAAGDFVAAHLNQKQALDSVNAVIDTNVRKSVEGSDAWRKWEDVYSSYGVTADELTGALRGNEDAIASVDSKMQSYNSNGKAGIPTLDEWRTKLDEAGQGALDMGTSIGTANDNLSEAQRIQKDVQLAMDKGSSTAKSFAGAMDDLGSSASNADQKTSALKAALDSLNGGTLNLEQAQARLNEAFDSTSQAIAGQADEFGNQIRPSIDSVTGAIDSSTEAGRRFLDAVTSQRDGTLDLARAAGEAAMKNGDLAAGQRAAADVVVQSRQTFVDQIATLGIVGDEAQRLADRYIGIPGEVSTLVTQPNMATAQLALDILKDKVDLVPNDKSITVETLDEAAVQRLEALGFKVERLPNGSVKVDAETAEANRIIEQLINQPRSVGVDIVVNNPGEVDRRLESAVRGGIAVRGQTFAEGGPITGGVPGKDSVPILAMPGEHMLDVDDVNRLGGQAGVYRFREALAQGKVQGFANGGAIVDSLTQYVGRKFPALQMTSGYRGGDDGYHGQGMAADFSNGFGNTDAQLGLATLMASKFGSELKELIYDDPRFGREVKDGSFVDDSFYDGAGDHTNHVHIATDHVLVDSDTETAEVAPLSERDQIADAIIAEGRRRGITDNGIKAAVMTGLAESNLALVEGGPDTSTGPFQQQDPWGSYEERMDPTIAAGKFYDRLVEFDYDSMDPADAAQRVQQSAFSDGSNYRAKSEEADGIIAALGSRPASGASTYSGSTKKVTWAEKDQIALDRAVVAVTQAEESRDETYANDKKSQADREQADLKVKAAKQKVVDLQAKKDAAASGGTSGPAPQAPDLAKNYSENEITAMRAQLAVDSANTKRNEVYADPESTAEDKQQADLDLASARNSLAKQGSESGATGPASIKGRIKEGAEQIAGILVDAVFEQIPFGLADSHWWDLEIPNFGQAVDAGMFSPGQIDGSNPVDTSDAKTGPPAMEWTLSARKDWQDQFAGFINGLRKNADLRDTGGILRHGAMALNLSGQDEWVTTKSQRDDQFRQIANLRTANSPGAAGAVDLSGINQKIAELTRAVDRPNVSYHTENIDSAIRKERTLRAEQSLTFTRRG